MNDAGVTLCFDELPPGLNGRNGLLRMFWKDRQQLNYRWHMLVREARDRCTNVPTFDEQHPCEITAVRYSSRIMDWDNFGASLKPVLDGLVKCEIITNDNPAVVRTLKLRQVRPQRGQKVALTVTLTPV